MKRLILLTIVAAACSFAIFAAAVRGAEPTCDGKAATPGTKQRDGAWHGTDGDDVIIASGKVYGYGGNDTICGGGEIHGGRGNDDLFGGAGYDTILGDKGNDYLYGGHKNDTFDGGPGSDVLDGECCNYPERFEGRNDDVAKFLGVGDVHVDLLTGVARTERGTDTIMGITYLIITGAGDDVLRGSGLQNKLHGRGGDDRLFGRGSTDKLIGGGGTDYADGGADKDACRKAERMRSCEA